MALFRKKKTIRINPLPIQEIEQKKASIPEDMVKNCPNCKRILINNQISQERICYHCGEHLYFAAKERVDWLVDSNTFESWDDGLSTINQLNFPGYNKKISEAQKATGLNEAVLTGKAMLNHKPFCIGVMDSHFIMASMGSVVGEKITNLFERATDQSLSVVLFVASGGARMQEGILSLMQMAKVSQAVAKHQQAGLFYCAVLTNPTMGGVTASFGMQGDVTLAEPHAKIGFAGKRVIEQTIRSTLPDDFQSAESLLENGYVDEIVPRSQQKATLDLLLQIHQK
ncbi:acetyl-CoA carboxylase, carboxyltransferase subunit beta [Fundicoccus culcitae]|uniref:Acetyl-coenzyme A carboxylase carboxyl transferase subunit beta n=1 Tax=Fundicoccus culcitae TaxID=2969821 RepID=A0ABY5P6N6_9LACT|nr:acetyl-CoA carboxylase, carboxyltransferase subunit beta [Fundicoccus culcitae]UUX34270.1 acetyl-CoA carboxylase, carboxyltransferase subunit beta [Fundicoccus culcitae]